MVLGRRGGGVVGATPGASIVGEGTAVWVAVGCGVGVGTTAVAVDTNVAMGTDVAVGIMGCGVSATTAVGSGWGWARQLVRKTAVSSHKNLVIGTYLAASIMATISS